MLKGLVRNLHFLAFGLLLGAAAYIRFWAAPLSAGPDVAQFWAFASVFHSHGLDFYRYAEASLPIFPQPGWGFVYPPVWLLVLGLALLAAPGSAATASMVDAGWRLAAKTPIIAADLGIGCLLYWAVPGSRLRKFVFAALWLLHPTAWYESAVFGQFDAVAAALLLAAVIIMERGRDRLAFLLAGLAVMTKQHTAIPVLMLLLVNAREMGWRRMAGNLAVMAGLAAAISIPFLVTGQFLPYLRAVCLPGQLPSYDTMFYVFSGPGSLLTYLHDSLGWETIGIFKFTVPVLVAAVGVVAFLCYRRRLYPAQGALAGFLVLIALCYRVNYQYIVVYLPLALLVAARTRFWGERVFTLALALLPAAWLWLYDVSFWFTYLEPASAWVVPVFERLGLTRLGLPDAVYLALALALMSLSLAYVALAFCRWRRAENGGGGEEIPFTNHA